MMSFDDALFMLYPHLENTIANANNCGLYFKMNTIESLKEKLEGKARILELVDKTEYGRKEITILDCYDFQITFSSEPD